MSLSDTYKKDLLNNISTRETLTISNDFLVDTFGSYNNASKWAKDNGCSITANLRTPFTNTYILTRDKMLETPKSPIKSGWRGNLNGFVCNTEGTAVEVSNVRVSFDSTTAHALCNILTDSALQCLHGYVTDAQRKSLSTLGAAIGRLIDHPSANNGNRECIK